MAEWLPLCAVAAVAVAWPRLAWRWLTGLPLDGPPGRPRYRTDAGWKLPATKRLHPVPVIPWHWWPRWRRAAIRGGGTLAALGLAEGLIVSLAWTLAVLAAAVIAAAWLIAPRVSRKVTGWQHHRAYVRPLAGGYRHELGAPPQRLMIAADRSRVVIDLHPDFTGSPRDKEAIARVVTTKVMPELEADWSGLAGRKPQVTFTKPPQPPPAKVTLKDIRAAVDASGPDDLVIGLGVRRAPVLISLADDACHLALSVGPGGGKTTAAKWLGVQILYKGGLLVVLNAKKIGYSWMKGLPSCAQAKDLPHIGEMLLWLDGERVRREDVADASVDIEDEIQADVGARILVIFEEMNLTVPALKKAMPEAIDALGNLGFAGRQSRMHLLPIAQRYSAKAAGGGDIRASVGTRILGRYDKDAWNMLAKSFAMPPMNNNPGRVQVATSEVNEAQIPRLSGQEAHDYALAGKVAICPGESPDYPAMPYRCAPALVSVGAGTRQINGSDQHPVLGRAPLAPYEPDTMTLAQAHAAGIFRGRSFEAVRRATTRDPRFARCAPPVGRDGSAWVYSEDDLHESVALTMSAS
jgi:hypothetical protein